MTTLRRSSTSRSDITQTPLLRFVVDLSYSKLYDILGCCRFFVSLRFDTNWAVQLVVWICRIACCTTDPRQITASGVRVCICHPLRHVTTLRRSYRSRYDITQMRSDVTQTPLLRFVEDLSYSLLYSRSTVNHSKWSPGLHLSPTASRDAGDSL